MDPNAIVSLFIVGWRVSLVEPAKPFKDDARGHEAGPGAIIHVPLEQHIRMVCRVAASVAYAGPIAPDD